MKNMLFMLALLVSVSADAANINKGDWELGGSFNLSRTDRFRSSTYWYLNGNAQYFFADHFSAGLDLSWSAASGGGPAIVIGPAATYYFLTQENMAPYVMLAPFNWRSYGTSNYSSTLRVGTKFFFTESVSFGPALQIERFYRYGGLNTIGFLGAFSIHL